MNAAKERWGWLAALAVLAVAAVLLLTVFRSVGVPLLLAFFFAYVFQPLLGSLERRGVPRGLASVVLVVGLGALLLGALIALVPYVSAELGELPRKLLQAYQDGANWVEERFGVQLPESKAQLEERLEEVESGDIAPLARTIYGETVDALGIAAGLALLPILAFFLLRDLPAILDWCRDLIPPRHRAGVIARFRELDGAIGGFVRGQLIVSGVMAVLYTAGFWIVGLPLAVGVGIISGIGNLVPYLGTAIGVALATLLTLLNWEGLTQLLAVYAVFVSVQVIEGWLLTPRIVGRASGISPLGVIVAILIFGELLGFLGLLLAIPLAAVFQLGARVALQRYKRSRAYRSELAP